MSKKNIFKDISKSMVDKFVSRNNDVEGYWGMGIICLFMQKIQARSIIFNLTPIIDDQNYLIFIMEKKWRSFLFQQMNNHGLSNDMLKKSFIKIDIIGEDLSGTINNNYSIEVSVVIEDCCNKKYFNSNVIECSPYKVGFYQRRATAEIEKQFCNKSIISYVLELNAVR